MGPRQGREAAARLPEAGDGVGDGVSSGADGASRMALERSGSVGKPQPACAPSDPLLSLDFEREAITEPRARFQVGPRQPNPPRATPQSAASTRLTPSGVGEAPISRAAALGTEGRLGARPSPSAPQHSVPSHAVVSVCPSHPRELSQVLLKSGAPWKAWPKRSRMLSGASWRGHKAIRWVSLSAFLYT